MIQRRANPWSVDHVDTAVVDRLAAHHKPDPEAVALGVDIVGDPHRENDEGLNWSLLSHARRVTDVVPGSAVVMGSSIGRYLAKVVAWDFEVSDEDPIVVLELVAAHPEGDRRSAGPHPNFGGLITREIPRRVARLGRRQSSSLRRLVALSPTPRTSSASKNVPGR